MEDGKEDKTGLERTGTWKAWSLKVSAFSGALHCIGMEFLVNKMGDRRERHDTMKKVRRDT